MKNIRVINSIPTQSASCDVTRYPHLTGMYCPGDVTIDLLIGQDFPAVLRPLDVKSGWPDEPFAVTQYTWLDFEWDGRFSSNKQTCHFTLCVIHGNREET